MTINKIFFLCLSVLSSCTGQKKPVLMASGPIPTVIKDFKAVGLAPDFDTTLVSQYIRSIFQDSKGNLWFGTIGEGVVRYDEKTLRYFSTSEGFICETVYAINEDKKGNMWFGTDQGVYKFDGKQFKNYSQKDGLSHIDITRKGILIDKTGQVWVGTHKGVYLYNPAADSLGRPCFSLFDQLPVFNVAGLMEDKSGHIWFASTNQGVFRFDGTAIIQLAEKDQMGENYAGGLAQDPAGNMWFTMKNGICRYNPSASIKQGEKSLTEYTNKDGLGGTEIWGIYIEKSGIIWVTARGSTTRFDPSLPLPNPRAFTVFTPADGLNCCVQSMFQDSSGQMWWGTGQGLYQFNGTRFYQVKKNGPWSTTND